VTFIDKNSNLDREKNIVICCKYFCIKKREQVWLLNSHTSCLADWQECTWWQISGWAHLKRWYALIRFWATDGKRMFAVCQMPAPKTCRLYVSKGQLDLSIHPKTIDRFPMTQANLNQKWYTSHWPNFALRELCKQLQALRRASAPIHPPCVNWKLRIRNVGICQDRAMSYIWGMNIICHHLPSFAHLDSH